MHVHPRGRDGAETIDAGPVAACLETIATACPGVTVSVTTGYWIEPNVQARAAKVAAWEVRPHLASVNISEPGAMELCDLLLDMSVGIEAGLSSMADARLFASSEIAPRCVRALIEIDEPDPEKAVEAASRIDAFLEHNRIDIPRLHHGYGRTTWAVLKGALVTRRDVRVGLEDTLVDDRGDPVPDNAALVTKVEALRRGL